MMQVLKSAVPAGAAIATAVFWYPGSLISSAPKALPGAKDVAVHATHSAQQSGETVLRRQFDVGPAQRHGVLRPEGRNWPETAVLHR